MWLDFSSVENAWIWLLISIFPDSSFFDKDNSTPLWNYTSSSENANHELLDITLTGDYIVAGDWQYINLFHKDSNVSLWNYSADSPFRSVAISGDGEYIAAGTEGWDEKGNIYLFGKDSSTPIWDYYTKRKLNSLDISNDGKYIVAGTSYPQFSNGEKPKIYMFEKNSSTPIWNYTSSETAASVSIAADGKYIAAATSSGDGDGHGWIFLFDKNVPPVIDSFVSDDFV